MKPPSRLAYWTTAAALGLVIGVTTASTALTSHEDRADAIWGVVSADVSADGSIPADIIGDTIGPKDAIWG